MTNLIGRPKPKKKNIQALIARDGIDERGKEEVVSQERRRASLATYWTVYTFCLALTVEIARMSDSDRRTKRSRFDQTEPEPKRQSRFDRRSRSPSSRASEPVRDRSPINRRSSPGSEDASKPATPSDPAAAAGEFHLILAPFVT